MALPDWLLVVGVIALFSLAGGASLVFIAMFLPSDEGNRPAPPEVRHAREEERLDALERIAARRGL